MDDYDEFGNYIGEEVEEVVANGVEEVHIEEDQRIPDSDDEIEDDSKTEMVLNPDTAHLALEPMVRDMEVEGGNQQITLHEDKVYYPRMESVYGPGVEIVHNDRDGQSLEEPMVEPEREVIKEEGLPETTYQRDYQVAMMSQTEYIRNVSIVGNLHHGKTALCDMLIEATHKLTDEHSGHINGHVSRYTDTAAVEIERGVSTKTNPLSMLLADSKHKSHAMTFLDTPGHVNFYDEVICALSITEGALLVVDVVEGPLAGTKEAIRNAFRHSNTLTLCINKLDRLILDLRLPPADAYYKIANVIDEINIFIASEFGEERYFDPLTNVMFASAKFRFVFTLESMARKVTPNYTALTKRLWGNVFYNPETSAFSTQASSTAKRAFVYFVLEPLYKVFSTCLGEEPEKAVNMLSSLKLPKHSQKLDAEDLIRTACIAFFETYSPLVDILTRYIPAPKVGEEKEEAEKPTVVKVAKLIASADRESFYALSRIVSGSVRLGQKVKVLGAHYVPNEDEEDCADATITDLFVSQTRYKYTVVSAPVGNIVLIGGIDKTIIKNATVTTDKSIFPFSPLQFTPPVFKISIEPVNPSELPKMLDSLRKCQKSYPLLQTKVEESGEHVILGSGELYVDCVMHDMRLVFARDLNVKVSDPTTRFCETCVESSAIKTYAETPNKKSKITIIAEPLEEDVSKTISLGQITPTDKQGFAKLGYDALASRNVWAFGPTETSPNLLLNDTIPGEVNKQLLNSVKDSVVQGFMWATREGPLCEEPLRDVKFKVMDLDLADKAIFRGAGQIIPTTRRACYSSYLLAGPRLMEPIYSVHVTCPHAAVKVVLEVLEKRRGHLTSDTPIGGTTLYEVMGYVPVMDSFGLETDIRVATQGQALVSLIFNDWQVVPGDPLDRSIKLPSLQAMSGTSLARDFVVKTRRHKGLSDDPTVTKYLDDSLLKTLTESGLLG
ncbi:P-loop containing nucleoside triphosphate hydrolase protein [Yarrowia lipolytica]|uniref:116 kDa U5 small nuclear ribonucleoprotein component n=2 Tax=Yarrowia lipolytica TaxID=4952 RepID=Q6CGB0_YARLI|nr:YALI0A20768p [Yarrowia lipolytica CLIB122]AOW00945.1 hypothetical protein YALI1_A21797g [Yarrowia lipolytica]KAB8280970.1 P-loop containing nucleoside triphosphate hydrolase protein [Yarrowia lipolytica]KAE8174191.1 P-loop containing nucleoside triphosphate hydrolase protein [Yarrowia lipolytica]KAJ8051889.1 P-loop containing nucleoside triphosphate hydrolase protein [Yarrowia lipolytica]QNP95330.1 116 kDa U5 small nuclear ribonucleoprotein component [Yarrowia lipolytica]|eukprot:XP_500302.1 YALI0A20768p [Yarrowia lipolytica CLIB122]